MATFEFNGKGFYIDGKLKKQLDEKVVPDLLKKDKDIVFIVDGRERTGKSVFAMILGAYMASKFNTAFDLTNICLNPTEFRERIEKSNKNDVVIYDEAHRGMGSSSALSEVNKILKDLMMEMGQKNLFVVVVLPTFFELQRYQALFRTSGLFHVYERKRKRGFWVYLNERHKMKLYMKGKKEFNYNVIKWPPFRGRFLNQYPIDETQYRTKKGRSFKEKERKTLNEKYMEQRDKLMYVLSTEIGCNIAQLSKMMKYYQIELKRDAIKNILDKFEMNHKKNIKILPQTPLN